MQAVCAAEVAIMDTLAELFGFIRKRIYLGAGVRLRKSGINHDTFLTQFYPLLATVCVVILRD